MYLLTFFFSNLFHRLATTPLRSLGGPRTPAGKLLVKGIHLFTNNLKAVSTPFDVVIVLVRYEL